MTEMELFPLLPPESGGFNLSQILILDESVTTTSSNVTSSAKISNITLGYTFDDSDIEFQRIILLLNTYVLPIIIVIGIVGNTLSFFVYLWTPRLLRQSSSLYLAFLAMVDNISLISVLFVWFGWVGVHIFHKNGWCQTITYGSYVCSFLSAWTVVTFTFERWIIVFHPLRRHELCTRRRAIIVMTSLTLASLAFYSFALYTSSVSHHNDMPICTTRHNDVALKIVRSIDTVVTVFVPLVTIIVMNTGIGIKICHYTGHRGAKAKATSGQSLPDSADEIYSNCSTQQKGTKDIRLTGAVATNGAEYKGVSRLSVGTAVTSGVTSWRVLTRRQHTQVRVTSALLVVSTSFVVLNLPSYAFRIHAFIISIREEAYDVSSFNAFIWQEFIQFLYYSNISSRFFLYMACSRNFRYAVKRLACRQRCQHLSQCCS